jgi:hypothetical protein
MISFGSVGMTWGICRIFAPDRRDRSSLPAVPPL